MKNFLKNLLGIDAREPWQKKIDEDRALKVDQERLNYEKATTKSVAGYNAEKLAQDQAHNEKIRLHKEKYKCHICGTPSMGPFILPGSSGNSGFDYMYPSEEIWDHPTGLSICQKCGKLACEEHLYKGVCKTCAENS